MGSGLDRFPSPWESPRQGSFRDGTGLCAHLFWETRKAETIPNIKLDVTLNFLRPWLCLYLSKKLLYFLLVLVVGINDISEGSRNDHKYQTMRNFALSSTMAMSILVNETLIFPLDSGGWNERYQWGKLSHISITFPFLSSLGIYMYFTQGLITCYGLDGQPIYPSQERATKLVYRSLGTDEASPIIYPPLHPHPPYQSHSSHSSLAGKSCGLSETRTLVPQNGRDWICPQHYGAVCWERVANPLKTATNLHAQQGKKERKIAARKRRENENSWNCRKSEEKWMDKNNRPNRKLRRI